MDNQTTPAGVAGVDSIFCLRLFCDSGIMVSTMRRSHALRRQTEQEALRRRTVKSAATMELIGCSREELIAYLEARFQTGMSWAERRRIHIDHVIPCASFDLTDPEQQRACFRYTNLQPLWASDNLSKGKRHE